MRESFLFFVILRDCSKFFLLFGKFDKNKSEILYNRNLKSSKIRGFLPDAKYELDHIQQTTKLLVNVHEELEKDLGYSQFFK